MEYDFNFTHPESSLTSPVGENYRCLLRLTAIKLKGPGFGLTANQNHLPGLLPQPCPSTPIRHQIPFLCPRPLRSVASPQAASALRRQSHPCPWLLHPVSYLQLTSLRSSPELICLDSVLNPPTQLLQSLTQFIFFFITLPLDVPLLPPPACLALAPPPARLAGEKPRRRRRFGLPPATASKPWAPFLNCFQTPPLFPPPLPVPWLVMAFPTRTLAHWQQVVSGLPCPLVPAG